MGGEALFRASEWILEIIIYILTELEPSQIRKPFYTGLMCIPQGEWISIRRLLCAKKTPASVW